MTISLHFLRACIIAGVVAAMFFITGHAQAAGWYLQNQDSSTSYYDVATLSATKAVVVGKNGIALYTTDAGATWSAGASGVSTNIYAVDAESANIAFAAGFHGMILKTTNGGATWTTITSGSSKDFFGIDMYSNTVGTIVGENSIIFQTTDGIHWTPVVSGISSDLWDVSYASSTTLYSVGVSGVILKSVDGGSTWVSQTSGVTDDLYGIWCADESTCYAVGENGATLKTSDGGVTWSIMTVSGITLAEVLSPISGVDANTFMLDGGSAGVISTTDAGAHWIDTTFTNTIPDAYGIDMLTDSIAYMVGYDGSNSYIYRYDAEEPTVGPITPTSADVNIAVTFSITADDLDSGLTGCSLTVDGTDVSVMTNTSGTTYQKTYTFSSVGTHTAVVECTDLVGNSARNSITPIFVGDPSTASTGRLIKTACPGGEDVNDPCRAVYWNGADGKRHAFPNDKVFFTWFSDFDDVVTVSTSEMASLPLGKNVTYHPGTKMVKFLSLNDVYAVAQGGVLRHVTSESLASSLYGSNWAQKIDDISDAFYGNYSFGSDILTTSDYDVTTAIRSVTTIDDNF